MRHLDAPNDFLYIFVCSQELRDTIGVRSICIVSFHSKHCKAFRVPGLLHIHGRSICFWISCLHHLQLSKRSGGFERDLRGTPSNDSLPTAASSSKSSIFHIYLFTKYDEYLNVKFLS